LSESHFSASYSEARSRFLAAAESVGAAVHSYPIKVDGAGELAIDVAILGNEGTPTVVTSSGIHGVEGFFGSAVQLALLQRASRSGATDHLRHVLIHSINPFGFSQLRRFNEENVDLNRNFVSGDSEYRGAPPSYSDLNRFLNPESPPAPLEPFKLKAVWNIWRHGMQALQQAVAGGQYEYPRGLFFGGEGPCQSTRIIREQCDSWIGRAETILHLDFHSGLGRFGNYRLLLAEDSASENCAWFTNVYGADTVEALDRDERIAYTVSGLFGEWMQRHFAPREYRFVVAEIGTHRVTRILGALRAENRAYHYGAQQSAQYRAAKRELLECFCPKSTRWRQQAVDAGLAIIDQGAQALLS